MPIGFNVLPYRLEVQLPETAIPRTGLFFEHLVGRIHIQAVDESGECVLELRDENQAERYTLDLSRFEPGARLTVYIATEIDPPRFCSVSAEIDGYGVAGAEIRGHDPCPGP